MDKPKKSWILAILFLSLSLSILACTKREKSKEIKEQAGPDLRIIQKVPSGVVNNVVTQVSITFDRPMVPLTAFEVPKDKSPARLSCNFEGEWRWVNITTLNYFFKAPVPPSNECEVLIKAGLKAEDGSVLKEDEKFRFETTRIQLIETSPYGYAQSSSYLSVTDLQQEIAVTFNQPVEEKSLEEFGYFLEQTRDQRRVKLEVVKIPDQDKELTEKGKGKFLMGKIGQNPVLIELMNRRDLSRTYLVRPKVPLNKDTVYTLNFDPGLRPLLGTLPSDHLITRYFRTYPPFKVMKTDCSEVCPSGCDPDYGFCIYFSTGVDVPKTKARIKISPGAIKISEQEKKEQYTGSMVCLDGPFQPETKYVITLPADLKDIYGQTLEGKTSAEFITGNQSPVLWMPSGMGVLELKQEHLFPLKVRNVNQAELRIKAIPKNQIIPFYVNNLMKKGADQDLLAQPEPDSEEDEEYGYEYYDYGDYFPEFTCNDILAGEQFIAQTLSFKPQKNMLWWEPLDFEKLLGSSAQGKYIYLDLHNPDPSCVYYWGTCSPYQLSSFFLTDIGISAKIGYFNSLIWTSSLTEGIPLAGVNLEIRNNRNEILWKGVTDSQGLAFAPGKKDLYKHINNKLDRTRFWVFAEKENDLSFLNNKWSQGISAWDFNLPSVNFAERQNLLAYAVIDRPIYRPGDKVNFKILVRSEGPKGLTKPIKDSIFYLVKNSRDEEVYKKKAQLSEFGSAEDSFQLSEDAKLGTYTIYLGYDEKHLPVRHTFRVEEYRKPSLEIKVEPDKEQVFPNDEINFRISARYHFGAPVKDKEVDYLLEQRPASFQPARLKGYSTRNYYQPETDYEQGDQVIDEGSLRLDQDGKAIYSKNAPTKLTQGPMSYWLEVEIQDEDQRQVANRASVLIHPAKFYLGIKSEEWGVEAGKPIKFSLLASQPDGTVVKGAKVKLTLIRRVWLTVREQRVAGFYHYESKVEDKVIETKTSQTSELPVEVEFTPKEGGYYFVVAETQDEDKNQVKASWDFYVWGGGYVSWERFDHDRIDLVPEKTEYQPGETARILVKNPYGECNGILTVERKGVLRSKPIQLKNGAELLEVPIEPGDAPNVYVSVMLVKGRVSDKFNEEGVDLGKPSMKIGYAQLSVIDPATRLAVEVKSDQDRYQPGENCTVKIQVNNNKGEGQKSELAIAVVDEALLQLVPERPYFPHQYFYAPRSLDVESADTRLKVIGRRHFGKKGAPEGGGGGISAEEFRTRFVDTAFWKGMVETNDQGFAQVSFKLPDNLTSFHIFVVANDSAEKFGTGEKVFQVSKPLMVVPSLPRFLIEKDQFLAGAIVHNQTGSDQQVAIKLETEGVEITGESLQKVFLKSGSAQEVRWPVQVKIPQGEAVFKYSATAGRFKDAVVSKLPVKMHLELDTYVTYGNTLSSVKERILLPGDVRREVGHLAVDVSSSMVTSLKGAFEYLYSYEYDCLEQRTSKSLMFMIYPQFRDRLKLDYITQEKVEKYVYKIWLAELPQFQRPSGSYDHWKIFGAYDQPWLTAYVCLVLQYAQGQKIPIPEQSYKRALDYLEHTISYDAWPPYYDQKTRQATRAFILLALARAGRLKPALLEPSIAVKDELPPFAQASLLEAYARSRQKDRTYEAIHQALFNHAEVTSGQIHFDEVYDDGYAWILYSDIRSNALIMTVLNYLEPNGTFNYKLMRYLVDSMKTGRWRNTQENAFSLWAITDYLKIAESEKPNFWVRGQLENKELFKNKFTDYKAEPSRSIISLLNLPPQEKVTLFLDKQGPGRMYYRLELKTAKVHPLSKEVNAGLQISRKYYPVEAKNPNEGFLRSKLVQVVLTLKVPRERHFVVITDPLPAGFEVVNLSLETEEQSAKKYLQGQTESFQEAGTFDEWQYYYRTYWYRFVEMHDDRVTVYSEYLPAGTYTFIYLARATSAGTFLAPAPKAEEMYEPETYGRGLFEKIQVK